MSALVNTARSATRPRRPVATLAALALLGPQASAAVHRLNAVEAALFKRISHDSEQQRHVLKLDPILCKVARSRASDMARHGYFGHTDLLGRGPNRLVRRAGFVLPSWYDKSRAGNNIESIVLTGGGIAEAVKLWKGSPAHHVHVFGTASFYQDQEAIGVGTFTTGDSPTVTYYVFLSAPENPSLSPPQLTLVNPVGRVVSSTR